MNRFLFHCKRCNHYKLAGSPRLARMVASEHWDKCHRKEFGRDAVKEKDYEFFPKSERSYQILKSIPQKEFNKALL